MTTTLMMKSNYDFVSSSKDLTVDLLTCILQEHYDDANLQVLCTKWKPIPTAVLSQVYELKVDVIVPKSRSSTLKEEEQPTTKDDECYSKFFIAKFLKPSIPLSEMFRVEGEFYKHYAKELHANKNMFSIAGFVTCGPRFLLIEKVSNIQTYSLLKQGCPSTLHIPVIRRLARLHAHFWERTDESHSHINVESKRQRRFTYLSNAAGIGSALSGSEKQPLFIQEYPFFAKNKYKELCRDLANLDLEELHNRVHSFQPTLIHGDFHVGNLLFSSKNQDDDHVHLIDWATCGNGNPMLDLVFFHVVSTDGSVSVKQVRDEWLYWYHSELIAEANNKNKNDPIIVSREDLWKHYCHCLVNQFVILVCYDRISRTFPGVTADYHQHFDNVNQRCAEAILELGGVSNIIVSPPLPLLSNGIDGDAAAKDSTSKEGSATLPKVLTAI